MVNDPISDLITRLRNAAMVRKDLVVVPYSNFRLVVLTKLEEQGYVRTIGKRGKRARKCIEVSIAYGPDGAPKLQGLVRVSKPGQRIYQSVKKIRPVKYGKGALILSTPKGILTGEEARKEQVGGEALFKIW